MEMEFDVAQVGTQNAKRSGPKSFRDIAALSGEDEYTDHIPGSLCLWEEACRMRGKAAGKAKTNALKCFVAADDAKDQPSWVRRWIRLVYSPIMEDTSYDGDLEGYLALPSTDPLFEGPYPSERYALFLDYYHALRIDWEDGDRVALRKLNAERKRLGIRWTLEYAEEEDGSIEEDSEPSGFNAEMSEESSIGNEVQMEDENSLHLEGLSDDIRGQEFFGDDIHITALDAEGVLGVAYTQDACMSACPSEFMAISSPITVHSGSPSCEYPSQLYRTEHPGVLTQSSAPLLFYPPPSLSSENAYIHPPLPYQTSSHSGDIFPFEGGDSTMRDARTVLHGAVLAHVVDPPGPTSIYDLAAICSPTQGTETTHILGKLCEWRSLDWLLLQHLHGRPTRRKDSETELRKEVIAGRLQAADAQLVSLVPFYSRKDIYSFALSLALNQPQPSWASQWIQFALSPHDPHYPHRMVFKPAFIPTVRDCYLLLDFFSLLMERTHDRRAEALTLLNSARKTRGLRFTLELPKERAKEFKKMGKVVDLDMMLHIESMGASMNIHADAGRFNPGGNAVRNHQPSLPLRHRATRGRHGVERGGKRSVHGRAPSQPHPSFRNSGGVSPFQRHVSLASPSQIRVTGHNDLPPLSNHCSLIISTSWSRPLPVVTAQPAPPSSKAASLTSKYTAMVEKIGKPEPQEWHVWAKFRADLCETTPYFRQYQSGIHTDSKSHMTGYLLDGYPSPGDIWAKEGRLIISHGGGGSRVENKAASPRKQGKTPGRFVPASSIAYPRHVSDPPEAERPKPTDKRDVALGSDQWRGESRIKNLIKARDSGIPVVLIVGKDYRWWPLKMRRERASDSVVNGDEGYGERGRYAVLGWYRVRDAWEELEPGEKRPGSDTLGDPMSGEVPLLVRCKFAFEWVEAQGTPWWIKDAERAFTEWLSSRSIRQQVFTRISSPSHCSQQPTETPPTGFSSPDTCEGPPGLELDARKVVPPVYTCGKCDITSPLIYHEGWFCTNAKCTQMGLLLDGRFSPEITLSYSQDFIDRLSLPEPAFKGHLGNDISAFVHLSPDGWSVIPRYRDDQATYEREHWNGRCCLKCGRLNPKMKWNVWTCGSCRTVIEEPVYVIYPILDFLSAEKKGTGGLLPDVSCCVSLDAEVFYADLDDGGRIYLIRPASNDLFDEMFREFQEQALGRDMFSRSSMRASLIHGMHTKHFQHNAGVPYNFSCHVKTESFEEGPPVVKRARHLLEEKASLVLNRKVEFNEVLSCAYKKEQSMNYHSDNEIGVQGTIAALSLGSPATMSFRRKSHAKGEKPPPACLAFRLYHGDILIMDGIGIQENYQHQVTPEGLRFAATARMIERHEEAHRGDKRGCKAKFPRKGKEPAIVEKSNLVFPPFPSAVFAANLAAAVKASVDAQCSMATLSTATPQPIPRETDVQGTAFPLDEEVNPFYVASTPSPARNLMTTPHVSKAGTEAPSTATSQFSPREIYGHDMTMPLEAEVNPFIAACAPSPAMNPMSIQRLLNESPV